MCLYCGIILKRSQTLRVKGAQAPQIRPPTCEQESGNEHVICVQGTALEALAYTPHSNMLDAYWQRTAAILAQKPDQADTDLEQEDEDGQQSEQSAMSPAAQVLAASQREAIAGPGRLVALQVGATSFSSQSAWLQYPSADHLQDVDWSVYVYISTRSYRCGSAL